MPTKTDKEKFVTFSATPELLTMLDKVCDFYRTKNRSHVMRLMIEDVAKSLETDDPTNRFVFREFGASHGHHGGGGGHHKGDGGDGQV